MYFYYIPVLKVMTCKEIWIHKIPYFLLNVFCNPISDVSLLNFGGQWPPSSELQKFVIARATTPCLLSFYWFLNQQQVVQGSVFLAMIPALSKYKSWVPWLKEEPLEVVCKTALKDLGVSWVDVVIRGLTRCCSRGLDHARLRATCQPDAPFR